MTPADLKSLLRGVCVRVDDDIEPHDGVVESVGAWSVFVRWADGTVSELPFDTDPDDDFLKSLTKL